MSMSTATATTADLFVGAIEGGNMSRLAKNLELLTRDWTVLIERCDGEFHVTTISARWGRFTFTGTTLESAVDSAVSGQL